MPIVATDWSISGTDVRYIGDAHGGASPSYATTIEFHRWLGDLSDDAQASGDDVLDITSVTPSDRSTDNIITLINGYNIDDTAAEHLYDGSVDQDNGATRYAGLVVVGAAPAGTELQVVQDGALLTSFWGSGLNADAANNILLRVMIKTRVDGADIDGQRLRVQARELGDTYGEFSLTAGQGNSTAAIFTAADLNNATLAATLATWDNFGNTEGYQLLDITGDTVGEPYYSQWAIGGGITPASPTINDLYEYTKYLSRRGTAALLHGVNGELFRGITHDVTYDGLSGVFTENNLAVWGTEVAWDAPLTTPGTVGEYYVFGTSGAVGKLLAIDDNTTSGWAIFAIEPGSGTVVDNDSFTRADGTGADGATVAVTVNDATAVGGRGLILADEGITRLFLQLLDGVAPVNNLPMWDVSPAGVYDHATGANALVNITVTSRAVPASFIGVSTGSALIGAYGIGMDPTDTSASDQFFDLDNVLRTPPNNVTLSVIGCTIGESRVLVGPDTGATALDKAQLTLQTSLTGVAVTSIVVTTPIPTDLPASGTLRVVTNNGFDKLVSYTSYTGSTFTIPSTNFSAADDQATAPKNVYVTAIDKLATQGTETATYVYGGSPRDWFLRVRDGGAASPEKTFETTISVGAGGGSANVIHTADA